MKKIYDARSESIKNTIIEILNTISNNNWKEPPVHEVKWDFWFEQAERLIHGQVVDHWKWLEKNCNFFF